MITSAQYCHEFRGLSTDDKNSVAKYFTNGQIPNGTVYFCIDTSEVYMYNGKDSEWVKL